MARLPSPGGDSGTWGDILNEYLAQSHTPEGALKSDTVGGEQLRDNSVTANVLAPNSVTNSALASDAVNASTILNGSITEILIHSDLMSKINGVDFASSVSGVLPLEHGGTGSSTKNFVDLSTSQTVGGNKIMTGRIALASASLPTTAQVRIGEATTDNAGGLEFGGDAYLYRIGTNALKTDGTFHVERLLRLNRSIAYGSATDTSSSVALTDTSSTFRYANASSNAITYALPSPTTSGLQFTFKKVDSSANTVTLQGTIDGVTNYVLTAQNQTVTVISTSTSGVWYTVNSYGGPQNYVDLSSNQTVTGEKTFSNVVATNFVVGTNSSQRMRFTAGAVNHGIEIGRQDSVASTPFIDFHSSVHSANDFDSRIIAYNGTATSGQGDLVIASGSVQLPAVTKIGTSSAVGQVWTANNTSGGGAWATPAPAANSMGVVVHGAVASTARPSGFIAVTWIGSVQPTNAVTNDIWINQ